MNGIDGAKHMTIHVTPEEGFSYASCEMHGFTEDSFDPSEMATSITNVFRPGRLVVACATKAGAPDGSYLWASSVSLAGYSCAGATCQELPTGGRVWFYSLVRDCFRRCPRTLSCPARLAKWPSFATSSMRTSPSEDRMDTLTPRSKRIGGAAFGDSGSSASEMDILDLDRSPTASDGCEHRRCGPLADACSLGRGCFYLGRTPQPQLRVTIPSQHMCSRVPCITEQSASCSSCTLGMASHDCKCPDRDCGGGAAGPW